MFEPIDNQKYANLAGCTYDTFNYSKGEILYGRTHIVPMHFHIIKNAGPCVLITSFSDATVLDEMVDKLPENVKVWFSNNVETNNPRVRVIPIGFAFNWQRTQLLMSKIGRQKDVKNIMYINFTRQIPRYPNPREGLYEMFGGYSWVTCKGGNGLTNIPPADFYDDIQSHVYVLSPPGAGPDCHRHWESIALGSIPIVLKSKATEILNDLPCLQVNSWDEVTVARLHAETRSLMERFTWPSMIKLDMDYWRKEITNAAIEAR